MTGLSFVDRHPIRVHPPPPLCGGAGGLAPCQGLGIPRLNRRFSMRILSVSSKLRLVLIRGHPSFYENILSCCKYPNFRQRSLQNSLPLLSVPPRVRVTKRLGYTIILPRDFRVQVIDIYMCIFSQITANLIPWETCGHRAPVTHQSNCRVPISRLHHSFVTIVLQNRHISHRRKVRAFWFTRDDGNAGGAGKQQMGLSLAGSMRGFKVFLRDCRHGHLQ